MTSTIVGANDSGGKMANMAAASEPAKAQFENLAPDQQKAVVEAVNPGLLAPGLGVVIKSPSARRWIYSTYAILAIAVGAIVAGFGVTGVLPAWLEAAQAVIAYLAVPIGGLAAVNTNRN